MTITIILTYNILLVFIIVKAERLELANVFASNNISSIDTPANIQATKIDGTLQKDPSIKSLRQAIEDLTGTYGPTYPHGKAYLEELDKQATLYREAGDNQTKAQAAYALSRLRRKALLANPALTKGPILFVVRNQYAPDHGAIHTVYNTGKYDYNGPQGTGPSRPDINIPGAAMKMLDIEKGERITTIIDCPDGWIREPDVYWDGTKIIFSMKKDKKDNYHIYEINVDGTGLKQLTFLKDIDDITPLYLPDNDIIFFFHTRIKTCPM